MVSRDPSKEIAKRAGSRIKLTNVSRQKGWKQKKLYMQQGKTKKRERKKEVKAKYWRKRMNICGAHDFSNLRDAC
jgi:hypothetical protein